MRVSKRQSKALTGGRSIQFVSAGTGFGYANNAAGTTVILGGQDGWTVDWRLYGARTLTGGIVETTNGGRTWTRATARVVVQALQPLRARLLAFG